MSTERDDALDRAQLEDARDLMLMAAAVLVRWDRRLQKLVDSLPDPEFAEETGDPLNLSAAICGLLEALLYDEIRPAVELLGRAAAWIEDPSTWQGPPSAH